MRLEIKNAPNASDTGTHSPNRMTEKAGSEGKSTLFVVIGGFEWRNTMSFYCDKYLIMKKEEIADGIFSVTVKAREPALAAAAGQFANISVAGFTLRRPISICGIDKESGTLRFVFEVRGKGTAKLGCLSVGDELDILAPLGNGFKIPDGKVIVIGGGIGVPPLLEISRIKGGDCTAILGFRDKSKIILEDEFKSNKSNVILCTDDGSAGREGLVTFPLAEELEKGGYSAVLACGPIPMLKTTAKMCEVYDVPCQVSMEQRMGCGAGACAVCSCLTVRNGQDFYSRVCKDGPVFNSREVKFDG